MIRPSKELSEAIEAALQAAYQAGWDDATHALVAAATNNRPNGAAPGTVRTKQARPSLRSVRSSITGREIVTKALRAKPGMQAGEIFKWAQAKKMDVTFDNLRQAIMRMTRKGTLVREGGGYALKSPEKK